MRHFYPLVGLAEGQVRAEAGDLEQALDHYARGEEVASQIGMRPMLWRLHAAAAAALDALSRRDEAEAKWSEARAVIDEMAGLFADEGLRGKFVKSATEKLH